MQAVEIDLIYEIHPDNHILYLLNQNAQIEQINLSEEEKRYAQDKFSGEENQLISFFKNGFHLFIAYVPQKENTAETWERFRRAGAGFDPSHYLIPSFIIHDFTEELKGAMHFAQGMVLSAYAFDKFKSNKKEMVFKHVFVHNSAISQEDIKIINVHNRSVYLNRDFINEPQLTLNTASMVKRIKVMAEERGIKVEIFNRRKIESLKMGGLLGVNKGSFSDPALAILHWNPAHAKNEKPYILVGKGVMFDTGGLNLKTGTFMNDMHMDMGGAATVLATMDGIAQLDLPLNIMAITPLTDNRPGNDAITPGDILTMYSGKTVEVVNTDAEGRLILADALTYAKRYEPEFVIDLATLTGSAARALGKYAAPLMRNAKCAHHQQLLESAQEVGERLVEFPMWDDYNETLKSDYADLKNLGGAEGGAITAAKFLEHFVDFPWMHIDIAGTAMLSAKYHYHSKGASGYGVRLLLDFFTKLSQ